MRRKIKFLLPIGIFAILITNIPNAYAHCPLCTAAVGVGVAVARFYGVNDLIIGAWVGGFAISTALWFSRVIKKRFKFQHFTLSALSLILTISSFYSVGLVGKAYPQLLGIDRLVLGIIVGAILTYLSFVTSKAIKKKKGGTIIPFQTMIITLFSLAIFSLLVILI